jgi:hypothetical protein
MVFLALTPGGLSEALLLAGGIHPVWCCPSAISEDAFKAKHLPNLTRFAYSIAAPAGAPSPLAQALDTIDQHHPGERVWLENAFAV